MMESIARKLVIALTTAAVAALPVSLIADIMWSSGPADGFAGAPGEGNCKNCHQFGPGDGSMQILGAPVVYHAGQTYGLTVQLHDPGQKRWGFELTAVNASGDGAGSFTITDPAHTQLSDNNPESARDYVKQTSAGTHSGTMDGPVLWDVTWTAPSIDAGPVTFYAAGDAADGNGAISGDYNYTVSSTAQPAEFGVPSLASGALLVLAAALTIAGVILLRMRSGSEGV